MREGYRRQHQPQVNGLLAGHAHLTLPETHQLGTVRLQPEHLGVIVRVGEGDGLGGGGQGGGGGDVVGFRDYR